MFQILVQRFGKMNAFQGNVNKLIHNELNLTELNLLDETFFCVCGCFVISLTFFLS